VPHVRGTDMATGSGYRNLKKRGHLEEPGTDGT